MASIKDIIKILVSIRSCLVAGKRFVDSEVILSLSLEKNLQCDISQLKISDCTVLAYNKNSIWTSIHVNPVRHFHSQLRTCACNISKLFCAMHGFFLKTFVTTGKGSLRRLCFHKCLSVYRGVPGQVPPGRYTPWAGTPPWEGTPPDRYTPWPGTPPPCHSACWDMVNKRVVRIPLECILVFEIYLHFCRNKYHLCLCCVTWTFSFIITVDPKYNDLTDEFDKGHESGFLPQG